MIKWFLIFSIAISMKAQSQDSLQRINNTRNCISMSGMKVLGSWGIANIGIGAAGWATAGGSQKYFYQMNTFWGAINTGVAALGYFSARKKLNQPLSAVQTLQTQMKVEKIFLVNAGLDLGYIGVGAYLQNRGNNRNDAKLKGYGSSVIVQGIFLAVFDAAMYKIQRNAGNKWRKNVQANSSL